MLRITLYQGCKVNEKYEEVFCQGKISQSSELEFFDYYLSSLQSEEIEIDNAYYENSGTLIFERKINEEDIYKFNYMKILAYNGIDELIWKRYCFIDNISIKHGCLYIDYKEDIWHSYSKNIRGFNNSILSGTRIKEYSNLTPKIDKMEIIH